MNPRVRLIIGCGAGVVLATAFPFPFFSMFFGGMLAGFIARRKGWLCGLIIPIPNICISVLYQALFVMPIVRTAMSSDVFHPPGGPFGFFLVPVLTSVTVSLPSFMIAVGGGMLGQALERRWSRILSSRGSRWILKVAASFITVLGVLAALGVFLVRNADLNRTMILRGELSGTIVWCDSDQLNILLDAARDDSTRTVSRDPFKYGGLVNPIWDPGRKKLIVSEWPGQDRKGRRLYFLERNGRGLTHIIGEQSQAFDYPSLPPDGTRLAFLMHDVYYVRAYGDAPTGRLMIMDMDEKEPACLLSSQVLSGRPSWRPDSQSLVFATTDSLIVSLHIGTGRQDTLWRGTRPSCSPDGTFLAYYQGIRPMVRSLSTGKVVYAAPKLILPESQGGPVYIFLERQDELVWSPDSEYLLFYARSFADIQGVWWERMVVRVSDGATLRLPGASFSPTGACWFD